MRKEKFKNRIIRIKNDEKIRDTFETLNEGEAAMGLNEWFGAFFYFCFKLGQIPFEEQYSKKYKVRNIWTGYFITLFLLAICIYCMLILENKFL